MKAKNVMTPGALYIYTDFCFGEISKDDAADFLEDIYKVTGVESIEAGRYHVDIEFALLFDPREVGTEVLKVFAKHFTDATETITSEDLTERLTTFYTAAGHEDNVTLEALMSLVENFNNEA